MRARTCIRARAHAHARTRAHTSPRSLLGTSFHPELTEDTRWHEYFLGMVASGSGAGFALPAEAKAAAPVGLTPREELAWGERPADMPLFGADAPY